jgi:NADH:ubiquinone oxidoreductase subunit C
VNVDLLLEVLRETFPAEALKPQVVPIDEMYLTLPPEHIHPAVHLLVTRFDVRHLSTITGEDMSSEIVLLYHFWDRRGLTLRTRLPLQDPRITTVVDLVPGAAFYEREVSEMLGVIFEGHPDPRALLLPDDWDGGPPLRRPEARGMDESREEVS